MLRTLSKPSAGKGIVAAVPSLPSLLPIDRIHVTMKVSSQLLLFQKRKYMLCDNPSIVSCGNEIIFGEIKISGKG
jgi:hypothetical protein